MDGSISELPVRLTNAKGIHGKTMALTTAGYMISFMRNSSELYRRQLKHVWDKKFECQPLEAEGMTVGIITHVEEIKNRVARKLMVYPAQVGISGTVEKEI